MNWWCLRQQVGWHALVWGAAWRLTDRAACASECHRSLDTRGFLFRPESLTTRACRHYPSSPRWTCRSTCCPAADMTLTQSRADTCELHTNGAHTLRNPACARLSGTGRQHPPLTRQHPHHRDVSASCTARRAPHRCHGLRHCGTGSRDSAHGAHLSAHTHSFHTRPTPACSPVAHLCLNHQHLPTPVRPATACRNPATATRAAPLT